VKLCLVALVSFCVFTPAFLSAQPLLKDLKEKKIEHKDDRVILDNGDTLTGEIKKMEFGILYFKSDRAVGTLELDWVKVQELQSKARYEFETTDGNIHIGIITRKEKQNPGFLEIRLDNGELVETRIAEILRLQEMQQSFVGRLSLTLDAGINFTQGNTQTQINLASTIRYVRPRHSLQMNLNSIFSGQKDSEKTSRHEFSLLAKRDLAYRWNYLGMFSVLHDNQQDLHLRSTFGGGFERTFKETNRTLFSGIIGFVYTRENYSVEGSDRNNGEILTGVALSTYKFRGSELNGYVLVFPSVTDPGRVRVDTNVYWNWEIVSDLYWKVSAFNNFDSSPPPESPKNNFGVTTSIGWSF
jgi:hypothetical protein